MSRRLVRCSNCTRGCGLVPTAALVRERRRSHFDLLARAAVPAPRADALRRAARDLVRTKSARRGCCIEGDEVPGRSFVRRRTRFARLVLAVLGSPTKRPRHVQARGSGGRHRLTAVRQRRPVSEPPSEEEGQQDRRRGGCRGAEERSDDRRRRHREPCTTEGMICLSRSALSPLPPRGEGKPRRAPDVGAIAYGMATPPGSRAGESLRTPWPSRPRPGHARPLGSPGPDGCSEVAPRALVQGRREARNAPEGEGRCS